MSTLNMVCQFQTKISWFVNMVRYAELSLIQLSSLFEEKDAENTKKAI